MEKCAFLCGVLRAPYVKKEDIISALSEKVFLTPPTHISEEIDFNFTDYYRREMGDGLKRFWAGFITKEKTFDQGHLAQLKNLTRSLEEKKFSHFVDGEKKFRVRKRTVNLDPGYLTPSKVVLASTKDFSHRIYLSDGIYGEVTLIFANGRFSPLGWTYPDYKTETFLNFAAKLRSDILISKSL